MLCCLCVFIHSQLVSLVGYVEFVLSPEEIQQHRRLSNDVDPADSAQPPSRSEPISEPSSDPADRPRMICVWGTDHMDGQKSIWLQQMRHLDQVLPPLVFVTLCLSVYIHVLIYICKSSLLCVYCVHTTD